MGDTNLGIFISQIKHSVNYGFAVSAQLTSDNAISAQLAFDNAISAQLAFDNAVNIKYIVTIVTSLKMEEQQ